MHESKTVVCPECDTQTTIHIDDQTCEHCSTNIAEVQREHANRVREVLDEVREVVQSGAIDVSNSRKDGDVITLRLKGDGEFALDNERLSDDDYDMDAVLDRQQELESIKKRIRSVDGVSDIEQWLASRFDENQSRGSKYGRQPNLEFAEDGTVVLFVGTNV